MANPAESLSATSSRPARSGVVRRGRGPASAPVAREREAEPVEGARRRTLALAAAAHDMKTPLATMAGYAELLATGQSGPLTPRQMELLREIETGCARLQRMVDDCLSFGLMEAEGVRLKASLADVGACLEELHGIWLDSFRRKGVALYLLAPPALAHFTFDYHKIQRAVSNLLENALKFTPSGGTVWLSWEAHFWERRNRWESALPGDRRRQSSPAPNACRICVCDTGPGIAPEFHQEIFDAFVRLAPDDGTPKSGRGGVGLGLAIARQMVQSHGGKIWVESELAAGSKFCLLLPWTAAPEAAAEAC
ncbi:MAG: sensor histidine kinase [Terriglobales bacterium]